MLTRSCFNPEIVRGTATTLDFCRATGGQNAFCIGKLAEKKLLADHVLPGIPNIRHSALANNLVLQQIVGSGHHYTCSPRFNGAPVGVQARHVLQVCVCGGD